MVAARTDSLSAVASLLARGYLRFTSPETVNAPNTPAVLACLDESAPIRLSVPSGLRPGESRPPQTDQEPEDEGWQWM